MSTAIYSFEDDAESVLNAMGLSGAIMHSVCCHGLAQYHTATPFHPANAPGTFMYNGLVYAMRELLVPLGWEFAEESLSFTFNSELSIALVVSSGNVHVGDKKHDPTFKYPKGPKTEAAIAGNAVQLGLFTGVEGFKDLAPPTASKHVDLDTFKTWWLLHYVDLRKEVMRAELSLPVGIGNSGEINQWESRIILDLVPFGSVSNTNSASDDSDDQDFDVEVRKKA